MAELGPDYSPFNAFAALGSVPSASYTATFARASRRTTDRMGWLTGPCHSSAQISSGVYGLMVYRSRQACEQESSALIGLCRHRVCLSAVAGAGVEPPGDIFEEAQ